MSGVVTSHHQVDWAVGNKELYGVETFAREQENCVRGLTTLALQTGS